MIERQSTIPWRVPPTPLTIRTALRRFTSTSTEAPPAATQAVDPAELSRWLEDGAGPLAERWLASVRGRDASLGNGVEELLQGFFGVLLRLLPLTVGPMRETAETLWVQVSELFGSLAAQRGLAGRNRPPISTEKSAAASPTAPAIRNCSPPAVLARSL